MVRTIPFLAAALLLHATAQAAEPPCAVCGEGESSSESERALSVEIDSGLTFSRLALAGKGHATAEIDPVTGQKRVTGGLIDLGGNAVQGRARIVGTPNRAVRVMLPSSVTMTAPGGGTAELRDFTTDLPPWPVLDASGTLEFSFGGSLVLQGSAGGALRGRIPISVEYN